MCVCVCVYVCECVCVFVCEHDHCTLCVLQDSDSWRMDVGLNKPLARAIGELNDEDGSKFIFPGKLSARETTGELNKVGHSSHYCGLCQCIRLVEAFWVITSSSSFAFPRYKI